MLWGKNCQVINCSRKDVFKEKVAVYRTIIGFVFLPMKLQKEEFVLSDANSREADFVSN